MKAKTLGYFKNIQNDGTCKAAVDLKVGMGVILDRPALTANLPADEDEAKACHRIVTNINDKPEIRMSRAAFDVPAGDYVRADDLTSVANMELEFAKYEIKDGDYDGLVAGDKLVFGTDGLPAKAASVTDYKVYFEVVEKTAYKGAGVLVVIRVQ